MKVLVAGGRDFKDRKLLYDTLNNLNDSNTITEIINGDAKGADKLSTEWAISVGCLYTLFPADWEKNGNAAGPIRNTEMLEQSKPNLVVIFPGGKGTDHMSKLAMKKLYNVLVVDDNGNISDRTLSLDEAFYFGDP